MSDPVNLKARIEEMRRPGIVKARMDIRESRKLRAAAALAHALSVLRWSQRQLATHCGVNERVVRAWLEASQQPVWIPLAMPRDGYLAFLEALLNETPQPSRTGTDD